MAARAPACSEAPPRRGRHEHAGGQAAERRQQHRQRSLPVALRLSDSASASAATRGDGGDVGDPPAACQQRGATRARSRRPSRRRAPASATGVSRLWASTPPDRESGALREHGAADRIAVAAPISAPSPHSSAASPITNATHCPSRAPTRAQPFELLVRCRGADRRPRARRTGRARRARRRRRAAAAAAQRRPARGRASSPANGAGQAELARAGEQRRLGPAQASLESPPAASCEAGSRQRGDPAVGPVHAARGPAALRARRHRR